ncbi:MFS transporter [Kitasatospora sp. NPDC052868]|uniref:MFS transporter n=1 Tax=Kitasatospora sp. NPDC052868 TaxID=3364060 RepID=UPI0037C78F47
MPRLTRDATTWLLYAQIAAYGYFVFGFGPLVPLLRDEQHTSRFVASLHGTAFSVAMLLCAPLFPPLVARFGRGRTLWGAMGGVAVGSLCLALAHGTAQTLGATLVTAFFGCLTLTAIWPSLSDHHGAAGPAAISEANAAMSGMGLLAPLVIGASVNADLGWRPGIALTAVLVGAVFLLGRLLSAALPSAPAPADAPSGPADAEERAPAGRSPRLFLAALGVIVAVAGVEVCLTQWQSDYLREHAGVSAAGATAAGSALVVGIFVGRLFGARFTLRFPAPTVLLGSLGVSAVGFALFWASTNPAIAVTGLVVCGLGMALQFPLAIVLVLATATNGVDAASSRMGYASGTAFGVAPMLLAAVSDRVNPGVGYLLIPLLLALAAVLTAAIRRAEPPATDAAAAKTVTETATKPAAKPGSAPEPATDPTPELQS